MASACISTVRLVPGTCRIGFHLQSFWFITIFLIMDLGFKLSVVSLVSRNLRRRDSNGCQIIQSLALCILYDYQQVAWSPPRDLETQQLGFVEEMLDAPRGLRVKHVSFGRRPCYRRHSQRQSGGGLGSIGMNSSLLGNTMDRCLFIRYSRSCVNPSPLVHLRVFHSWPVYAKQLAILTSS